MRHAAAKPQRVRQLSPLLGCDALAVYGYRAESPDGWRGPFRRRYRDALRDARQRNRTERHANVY